MATSPQDNWPEWWSWPLECDNPHVLKRMSDRGFDEIALRHMLEHASNWRPDRITGRFVIECTYDRQAWEVIVESDEPNKILVIVTAYIPD